MMLYHSYNILEHTVYSTVMLKTIVSDTETNLNYLGNLSNNSRTVITLIMNKFVFADFQTKSCFSYNMAEPVVTYYCAVGRFRCSLIQTQGIAHKCVMVSVFRDIYRSLAATN